MGEVASDGRTVLFVSHNLSAVERLCRSALLLDRGRIVERGPVAAVARRYLDRAVPDGLRGHASKVRSTGDHVRVSAVGFSVGGVPVRQVRAGETCTFTIAYECLVPGGLRQPPSFSLDLHLNGQKVAILWTDYVAGATDRPDTGTLRCEVPRWPFRNGVVRVDLYVHVGPAVQDWIEDIIVLESLDGPFYGTGPTLAENKGILFLDHSWIQSCR